MESVHHKSGRLWLCFRALFPREVAATAGSCRRTRRAGGGARANLADGRHHLSNVVVKNKLYRVRIRGRAWILADSYQVARLETDLAEPIPQIRMRLSHINVEYRPVSFHERPGDLWLPSSAELYMDFAGRRFYRRHSFTNFTLFSVDVEQQFASAATSSQ